MPFRRVVALLLLTASTLASAVAEEPALLPAQQQFRAEIAAKTAALEKQNTSATIGADGWLFLTSELRFLAKGRFWGDAAAAAARSSKSPDPLPAIIDFHRQLREHGIELLLVPVPPKAAVYPDKIVPDVNLGGSDSTPALHQFYAELRANGVDVLDLAPIYAQQRDHTRGGLYCRTDSHWSGAGCVLAAQAIAERVRQKLPAPAARRDYRSEWRELPIAGDLAALLPAGVARPAQETGAVRVVSDAGGGAVSPDANSPVLVLGDSHTLVFHEFLADRAGLSDQLAQELGFAPDLIGTRGSGATAVRISLYRRAHSDPGYLAKKKVVVWCFAAREFTEADQGWPLQPLTK